MSARIDLLYSPNCLSGTLFNIIDILRTINGLWHLRNPRKRDRPFYWRLINAQGENLPLPEWLEELSPPVLPRAAFAPSQTALIVPGLMMRNVPHLNQQLDQSEGELACIARYHVQGRMIGACYNGAAMLARAGVLDGRRATISWMIANWFADAFPQVKAAMEGPVVIDGPIFTAGAHAAQFDLIVELIRHFAGDELAQTAANGLLYHPMRFEQAGLQFSELSVKTRDSVVYKAKQWLKSHIQTPYNLDTVAEVSAVSSRTLLRHFKEVEGMTPLDYLQKLRIERAKQLLEVTLIGLVEVMEYCGYQDPSAFRRLFRRATGMTPSEYRQKYTMRASRRWWRADEDESDATSEDLIGGLGIKPNKI